MKCNELRFKIVELKSKFVSVFTLKTDPFHAIVGETLGIVFMLINPLSNGWSIIIAFILGLSLELLNEYWINVSPNRHSISVTMLFVNIGIVLGYLFRLLWN
jgi:hypothetical protein